MEQVLISQRLVFERRREGGKNFDQKFGHNSFLRIHSHGQEKIQSLRRPASHMGIVPKGKPF